MADGHRRLAVPPAPAPSGELPAEDTETRVVVIVRPGSVERHSCIECIEAKSVLAMHHQVGTTSGLLKIPSNPNIWEGLERGF
jgi:hypothetical protein